MASATEALKEKVGLTKKKPGFFDLLETMKPQIAMALPRHLTPDRMIRIAFTCCRLNPKLLDCTPESLIAAVMIASQLGLEPGVIGQAFLVPFRQGKDKFGCQLIPGWMGYLDLVSRSGKATAWTGAVYRGDQFDWALGDKPYLIHKPCGDETTLTHVYAVARSANSQWPILDVWTIEKVWKHRDKYNRIGEEHYSYKFPEQYARKLPLLQVLKYVPKSIELQAAISLENQAEAGGQTLTIKDVPNIIEGTGVFDAPELPPKSDTAKSKAAPLDEICAECNMLNSHAPDCKFHPANQQSVPSEAARQPARDGEGEQGHASPAPPPETAPAPAAQKANPFPVKKLVKVRAVEKGKSQNKKDYYKITAAEEDGGMVTMICWHTNRGKEIYDKYTEDCFAVFMALEKNDIKRGRFFEVEDIVSLAGKDYKDGKPIPEAAPADDERW